MDILVLNRLKAIRDTFGIVLSTNDYRDSIYDAWTEASNEVSDDGQTIYLDQIKDVGNNTLDVNNNKASFSFKDNGSGRTCVVSFSFLKEGEKWKCVRMVNILHIFSL